MEGVSGDSVRGEVGEGVRKLYRLARPLLGSTALSRIPCGVCPVSVGRGEGWREGGGWGKSYHKFAQIRTVKYFPLYI